MDVSTQGSPRWRTDADAALSKQVNDRRAPGITHTVVTSDAVIYEGQAGIVDASGDTSVGPRALFMACSITKVLTAIAILQLAQRGAMDLDGPASRYVEHPYGDGVTLAGLLAHTSGVPAPMPLDWFFVEGEPMDEKAALDAVLAAKPKLAGAPGQRYRYSNLGYWLLGRAIETVTSQTFPRAIETQIFEPLSIGADAATFSLPPPTDLATGHSPRWHPMTALFYALTPKRYWSNAAAGWSRFARLVHHGAAYGGLYATAGALASVLRDLLADEPKLLSPAWRERMLAPQATVGTTIPGTLGWTVGRCAGVEYAGKQGGGIGFHGNVRLYPRRGIGTVVLANSTRVSPGPIDALSDALDRPFLEEGG
jgi:CubicO group peptidase (beta-lactamase class C family)